MPPKIRFSKEKVIQAAFDITRADGFDALNARAIAKALGCSTQPLFRAYESMEQIKQAVRAMAGKTYEQHIMRGMMGAEKPYKASGMAYLSFARNEPELFKLLFMYDRQDKRAAWEDDQSADYVLDALMAGTGITRDQARRVHMLSWMLVHGMASMIATNYRSFTEEEADVLLTAQYQGNLLLVRQQMAAGNQPE